MRYVKLVGVGLLAAAVTVVGVNLAIGGTTAVVESFTRVGEALGRPFRRAVINTTPRV